MSRQQAKPDGSAQRTYGLIQQKRASLLGKLRYFGLSSACRSSARQMSVGLRHREGASAGESTTAAMCPARTERCGRIRSASEPTRGSSTLCLATASARKKLLRGRSQPRPTNPIVDSQIAIIALHGRHSRYGARRRTRAAYKQQAATHAKPASRSGKM